MPPQNFKCTQCGNCCLNLYDAFSTCATEEDIQLWKNEGREDILEWVSFIGTHDQFVAADIWISPETGEEVARCPWLRKLPNKRKYVCRIYDVKPRHCREYPQSKVQAEETGCRGFQESQLRD